MNLNFDLASAARAKESGSRLTPGIKNAIFKGVEFKTGTSQKSGAAYKAISLNLDIDLYGDYSHTIFEPDSNERKEGQWGLQASQVDHFLITIREILEAVNPQIIQDIDEGKLSLSGNFKQIFDLVKKLTDPFIGTAVQVKLIPGNNGYVNLPSYPARIDKNGNLAIATRIIGHDLTLTSQELKRIEQAKNAKPTTMSKQNVSSLLSDAASSLDTDDDMPF